MAVNFHSFTTSGINQVLQANNGVLGDIYFDNLLFILYLCMLDNSGRHILMDFNSLFRFSTQTGPAGTQGVQGPHNGEGLASSVLDYRAFDQPEGRIQAVRADGDLARNSNRVI